MNRFLCLIPIVLCAEVSAKTYYVAPSGGSDNFPGTISQPWATWQKAFETAVAGDTVYFRGGVWYPATAAYGNNITHISPPTIGHNGEPGNPICFFNYPGETPILDCKLVHTSGAFITGLELSDVHWIRWRGLTIRNVYQRKADVEASGITGSAVSNMIWENITIHNIGGHGWYIESDVGKEYISNNLGWDGSGYIPYDSTTYQNCDTYQCCDTFRVNPANHAGNMGDGFKHINGGAYVTYEGCRAWHCSDDGFDMPGFGVTVLKDCWSFVNGIQNSVFEGNGFKFGANDRVASTPRRILINCLAAHNEKGQGFFDLEYADYYRNKSRIFNCTSYKNNVGFVSSSNTLHPDSESIFKNNIVYKSKGVDANNRPAEIETMCYYSESHNNWDYAVLGSLPRWVYTDTVTVTDNDFISLDSTQLYLPRKTDGSLPDVTFLALAAGSDLIDAGTDIGESYYGKAPDLGYLESKSGIVSPTSPVYVNSVVENNTPSRLEITYNLSLANIVPATSAFTVKVNAITRTVSSVSISGTKVLLTLASPVIYGDVVTVAYTKPAVNPLQTNEGGQAASFSGQNVKNNVAVINPTYIGSVIENATPSRLEMTYNLTLDNIIPATSVFTVMVNNSPRAVNSVAISGAKVLLTLVTPVVYGDVVTVAYTKPASNPIQTSSGGQAASITAQSVINNCLLTPNQPPVVVITSPTKSSTFTAPATITIEATASDPDGSVNKVEFYNGTIKLGETLMAPYYFTLKDMPAGTYSLIAIATDNLGARSVSGSIEVIVEKSTGGINQLPVVNITLPNKSKKYKKHDNILIIVEASDPDGAITTVELKNAGVTFAELTENPYSYLLTDVDTGTYLITAVATDNAGASSSSANLELTVAPSDYSSNITNLYPNPNNGHFTVEFDPVLELNNKISIINFTGTVIYDDLLNEQESSRKFDLSGVPSGNYIILITNEKTILSSKKFIVK